MTASFGTPADTCTITVDQLQLVTQADGSFEITYLMEYADVAAELGEAVMSLGVIPEDKPYEVLHVAGNFNDRSMDGTYTITVCNQILFMANNSGPWKADLQQP